MMRLFSIPATRFIARGGRWRPLNFFGAYHQRGGAGANRLPSTVAAPVGKRSPTSTLVFAVTQCPAGYLAVGDWLVSGGVSLASVIALPRKDSIRGALRSAFDLQGLLVGIDFRQWLGHFEVNIVQTHFPLLDPDAELDTFVASLPSFRPGIEFVLSGLNAAGEAASLFQNFVVVVERFDDHPGERLDRLIERGDGGVQRRGLPAKVSRQSIAFGQLLLAEPESHGSSFHTCPLMWICGLVKVNRRERLYRL